MQVAHEPAVADRDPPAQPPPLYGSLGSTPIALLALLALMGLMALAPWLIWAPVVGGLALGILLLQTGLLRRWVAIQRERAASGEVSAQAPQPGQDTQAAGEAAGEAAGRALLAHARGHRVPEAPLGQAVRAVQVVQKVQAVRVPMVRMTHGGWLLTAALVLVGVQAAMLIATVQVQRATAVKPAPADRPRAQGQGPEEPVVEDRASGLSLLRPPAPDTSPRAGAADRGRPQEAAP